MTPQEAIEFLYETKVGCNFTKDKQLIDVCDIAITAIEKQIIPKKAKSEESAIDGEIDYICPVCNGYLTDYNNHCSYCGQALDWGDDK